MKFVIKAPYGVGCVYMDKSCLPSMEDMIVMYDTGCRLYVDGKKLTKSEALAYTVKKSLN